MEIRNDIDALKKHYKNYEKVAEALGISPRHLYGLRKGKHKASRQLKKYISELADRAKCTDQPTQGA